MSQHTSKLHRLQLENIGTRFAHHFGVEYREYMFISDERAMRDDATIESVVNDGSLIFFGPLV